MKKIVNLTGHNIDVLTENGVISIPAEAGKRIQLVQKQEQVGEIDWIPVMEQSYSIDEKVLNEIAPKIDWVIYIVSWIVAQATKRNDFYIVGQTIRSADRSTILGCKGICRNPYC